MGKKNIMRQSNTYMYMPAQDLTIAESNQLQSKCGEYISTLLH